MAMEITHAQPQDWANIATLLVDNHLPVEGLQEHLDTTLVVRQDDVIIACAALEFYEPYALLRSVCVDSSHQGQGLGHQLTNACLEMAAQHKIDKVFLLTQTAGDFFPRFGFTKIDRDRVPQEIRNSVEFASVCPVSSLVMVKAI